MQSLLEDNAPSASFAAMAAAPNPHDATIMGTYDRLLGQHIQRMVDKSSPHTKARWLSFGVMIAIYLIRVTILQVCSTESYPDACHVKNNTLS